MARRWQLNPPPNWPVPPSAGLDPDWRPDPAWGPPPVGWLLWRRERTALSVNELRLFVSLAAATLVLLGGGLIQAVPTRPAVVPTGPAAVLTGPAGVPTKPAAVPTGPAAVPSGPASAGPGHVPGHHRFAVPSAESVTAFEPWAVTADQARTADVLRDGVPSR